jgi:hypothetical protein
MSHFLSFSFDRPALRIFAILCLFCLPFSIVALGPIAAEAGDVTAGGNYIVGGQADYNSTTSDPNSTAALSGINTTLNSTTVPSTSSTNSSTVETVDTSLGGLALTGNTAGPTAAGNAEMSAAKAADGELDCSQEQFNKGRAEAIKLNAQLTSATDALFRAPNKIDVAQCFNFLINITGIIALLMNPTGIVAAIVNFVIQTVAQMVCQVVQAVISRISAALCLPFFNLGSFGLGNLGVKGGYCNGWSPISAGGTSPGQLTATGTGPLQMNLPFSIDTSGSGTSATDQLNALGNFAQDPGGSISNAVDSLIPSQESLDRIFGSNTTQ